MFRLASESEVISNGRQHPDRMDSEPFAGYRRPARMIDLATRQKLRLPTSSVTPASRVLACRRQIDGAR